MAQNKNPLTIPVIIILLTAVAIGLVRHFHIKNFNTVVPGVLYTSGQPKNMDYTRLLYRYHIASFVNVRMSSERIEDNWYNQELNWMKDNAARYIELPIARIDRTRQFPDEFTQRQFLELMSKKENLPVLLHGNSGRKRVSMLAAVWLIKSQKISIDKTFHIAEKIKGSKLTSLEKQFIQSLVG
jgi:tyrosine-protein phosphatase SIW14